MDKQDIIKNPYIKEFLVSNNLDESFVDYNTSRFSRVIASRGMCEGCKGIEECKQLSKGERLCLSYQGVAVEELEYCKYALSGLKKTNIRKDYVYCDVPENLLDTDLNTISYTEDQKMLYGIYLGILHGKINKGQYVYGDLGTGKTYLSIALANSLVKAGKKVAFIKVSDFFNNMKSYFSSNTSGMINKTVSQLQRCDYLFMDDIGAESVSEFVRDDILLRILEYRLENKLCTIFTSNLSKQELLKHYQYDRKEKANLMKARRLMERIDILSEDYVLTGKNLRRDFK